MTDAHTYRLDKEKNDMRLKVLENRFNDLEAKLKLLYPDFNEYEMSGQYCSICDQRWLIDKKDKNIVLITTVSPDGDTRTDRYQLSDVNLVCKCRDICYRCMSYCKSCDKFVCLNHAEEHLIDCMYAR